MSPNPITLKVGFDNAGGITLEVPEYAWSMHAFGDEADLAQTVVDLYGGAVPDHCWTNQWTEGVRVDYCERVVEASGVYELAYQLRTELGTSGVGQAFRAALEATETVKAVQAHADVEGYNDFANLNPDEQERDYESSDGELDAGYINGVGPDAICKAIGVPVSQWDDVRWLWCESFLRGRERAISDWRQEQE